VEKCYLMLFNLIFKAIKKGLEFLKLSRYFDKLEKGLPYLKEKERSKKILRFSTFKQIKLEKMAIAL
jgi:hypothetical protein